MTAPDLSSPRPGHRKLIIRWLLAINATALIGLVVLILASGSTTSNEAPKPPASSSTTLRPLIATTVPPTSRPTNETTTSTTAPPPETTTTTEYPGWWNPSRVGTSGSRTVPGVLTFRGSPTRSYYGEGPVPENPTVLWRFPANGAMCSLSTTGGVTSNWCGMGWTGQPSVFERNGQTWVAFGAYDRAVHLLDASTGQELRTPFVTGDIIKGSVTIDPDGFPLLYTGSRDGFFRILALDREDELEELYRFSANAVSPIKWNDDWDGSALIVDGYLFEGGENSQFHIFELRRSWGPDGLVQVDPVLVFNTPSWDEDLIRAVGNNVSIENSVAISGNTVYFANSGGLIQGWDLTGLLAGTPPERIFRFWAGDDIDASIVIDEHGMLYVGAEYERGTARSREVGQIMKLDPSRPDDPLVWSLADQDHLPGGVWGTPALVGELLYVATDGGRLVALDRMSGQVVWTKRLPGPLWQSPVVVDDVLIQGDCNGVLHGFDVSDPRVEPDEIWRITLGGCIEATPVVWRGVIYIGTRAGAFYALTDPS